MIEMQPMSGISELLDAMVNQVEAIDTKRLNNTELGRERRRANKNTFDALRLAERPLTHADATALAKFEKVRLHKQYINRAWRRTHATKLKKVKAKYYRSHATDIKQREAEYYRTHKTEIKKVKADYRRTHNKERAARRRERYATDPNYRLTDLLRGRLRDALKGNSKSASTLELLGCTVEECKAHLEAQFKDGMTWANQGEWHVDHIRPCASFDMSIEADQRACFHYTNLQPLWAADNISKGDKW